MSTSILTASCLCGDIRWEVDGPLSNLPKGEGESASLLDVLRMTHCHCSRCRKAHGAAYATYVVVPADRFRLTHGRESMKRYEGSRCFCGRCGSVVPDGTAWEGYVVVPAGSFDGDPGVRPTAHLFVGSKAPWFEIHDDVPRFDAFPPGFDAPVLPDRAPLDPPGSLRGSCLCGQATFVLVGPPIRWRTCHCSRCRKAGSAAHISYLATKPDGVRFTRGEDLVVSYKVPEARYFKHDFCRACGSSLPRRDRERDIAFVPMGLLDDDPGMKSLGHIFAASKAPWDVIADGLPAHDELPPS